MGDKAPAFALKTVDAGQPRTLDSFAKAKGMRGAVVVFLSCRCPYVAQARAPLAELDKQYGDKVAFVGLNANQNEKVDDIKADAALSFVFPMLRDDGSKVADLYGAERTPEAFVVEPSGVIRYHGGVDDLGPALAQLVAGTPVDEGRGQGLRLHDQKETVRERAPGAGARSSTVVALARLGCGASTPHRAPLISWRRQRRTAAPPRPPIRRSAEHARLRAHGSGGDRARGARARPPRARELLGQLVRPVRRGAALIETFAREAKARGVEFLSLSLDDPERAGDRVVKVLAQRAPSLTRNIVSVDDPDAFIGAIDPRWEGAIPAIFAYDSKGQLRGRLIGEASRRDLDGLVARLVKPSTK